MMLNQQLRLILVLVFLIHTLRLSLYHLFIWQVKEYRWDRMRAFFRTHQGRRFWGGPLVVLKWGLTGWLMFAWITGRSGWVSLGLAGFYSLITVEELRYWLRQGLTTPPLPRFSLRVSFIWLGWLGLVVGVGLSRTGPLILVVLDRLLGVYLALLMGVTALPAALRQVVVTRLARRKVAALPRLKVIGITGSYGKTTTRSFITQLLKPDYQVVQTPDNQNTAIGNARLILSQVTDRTDYLVLEAGAYRPGEIRQVMRLVGDKLKIAIITGLNSQHLELFGGFDRLADAKYEIIKALPGDGVAVFNANSQPLRKLINKARSQGYRVLVYGLDKASDVQAKRLRLTCRSIEFDLVIDRSVVRVKAPLIGRQYVDNLLAAALVAHLMGLPLPVIQQRLAGLQAPPTALRLVRAGRVSLVDDTYSANPTGVKAALEYLKLYRRPKIMILTPLIELGDQADKVHRQLGRLAGSICDGVVLTNRNYLAAFKLGFKLGSGRLLVSHDPLVIKDWINSHWPGSKVVLFEGREAESICQAWLSGES